MRLGEEKQNSEIREEKRFEMRQERVDEIR